MLIMPLLLKFLQISPTSRLLSLFSMLLVTVVIASSIVSSPKRSFVTSGGFATFVVETTVVDVVGTETTGTDAVDVESAGIDVVGTETTGINAVDIESARIDVVGTETTGRDVVTTESRGVEKIGRAKAEANATEEKEATTLGIRILDAMTMSRVVLYQYFRNIEINSTIDMII